MAQHGGKRPGAGRPKGSRDAVTKEHQATIAELARKHTSDAVSALVEVCKSGSDAARVSAASALLDRGYGKPLQTIDNTSSDGTMSPKAAFDVSKLSDAALAEIAALGDETDTG